VTIIKYNNNEIELSVATPFKNGVENQLGLEGQGCAYTVSRVGR